MCIQGASVDEGSTAIDAADAEIPELCGGKDPVTVTLTFRSGNNQNIELALEAISNIIEEAIVDFTMTPDGRKKDVGKGMQIAWGLISKLWNLTWEGSSI